MLSSCCHSVCELGQTKQQGNVKPLQNTSDSLLIQDNRDALVFLDPCGPLHPPEGLCVPSLFSSLLGVVDPAPREPSPLVNWLSSLPRVPMLSPLLLPDENIPWTCRPLLTSLLRNVLASVQAQGSTHTRFNQLQLGRHQR